SPLSSPVPILLVPEFREHPARGLFEPTLETVVGVFLPATHLAVTPIRSGVFLLESRGGSRLAGDRRRLIRVQTQKLVHIPARALRGRVQVLVADDDETSQRPLPPA